MPVTACSKSVHLTANSERNAGVVDIAIFTDESRPMGGFIPAEILVQNGTTGDNGTAGGTLHQPVG